MAAVAKNPPPDVFDGEIRVAARVIDFLSSGLYKNAAACMKELINNSYDADALKVDVSVKPDADLIAIEDDGSGFTKDQFVRHFSRLAESHKRDDGETTNGGRFKIGKIGIGFLAANELCDEMEIFTTCANSLDLLHVVIDFGEIRDRSYKERRVESGDVHKGDYHGEVTQSAERDEHYTRIYLKQIRKTAIASFVSDSNTLGSESMVSLYGLLEESAQTVLAGLNSWDELDLYSQTRVRIGLNVPVRYLESWAPAVDLKGPLQPFTRRARSDFEVFYDGTPLTKPVVLTQLRGASIVKLLRHTSERLSVQGYLYASHGALKPTELNGILIRVRESAVGEYDRTFMGFPQQINSLFQGYVSGELYVDGELDDALNIERRTLRDTHPAYVELQKWFLKQLESFLGSVRSELYARPAAQRKAERVEAESKSFTEIARRVERSLGSKAAEQLTNAWTSAPATPARGRPRANEFSRSFTINEIYKIALDVADDVLPQPLAAAYIAELTRRLRG